MSAKIQEGDCVWYKDYGYEVLEIKGAQLHIQELDGSFMGRNYIPGIDDIWVSASEVELFTTEDHKEQFGDEYDDWGDDDR